MRILKLSHIKEAGRHYEAKSGFTVLRKLTSMLVLMLKCSELYQLYMPKHFFLKIFKLNIWNNEKNLSNNLPIFDKVSSIHDVTQFWTLFDPLPHCHAFYYWRFSTVVTKSLTPLWPWRHLLTTPSGKDSSAWIKRIDICFKWPIHPFCRIQFYYSRSHLMWSLWAINRMIKITIIFFK